MFPPDWRAAWNPPRPGPWYDAYNRQYANSPQSKQESSKAADDVAQFSFFGDLSAVDGDSALGGALEDDLDAPPEEERVFKEQNGGGDLSYASMFGNILSSGNGAANTLAGAGHPQGHQQGTMADPLAELMAEELERERLEEGQRAKEEAERKKASAFSGGSIGLGGLLVPTSEEATPSGGYGGSRGVLDMPFPSPPPASMTPAGSRGVYGGQGMPMTPDMIMRQQQQQQQQQSPHQHQYHQPPHQQQQQQQQRPMMPPVGMPGLPMHPGMMMGGPGRPMMPVPGGVPMHGASNPVMQTREVPMQRPSMGVAGPPMPGPRGMPMQGPPPRRAPPAYQQASTVNLAQRLRALDLADKVQPQLAPQLQFTKQFSGRCMFKEEIDTILWMQSKPLRQNHPYLEDYYYQAFLDKHHGHLNKGTFAPESVRELAPTEKMAAESVAFVKLDGLGRVAFSNIRRPRPLMDLSLGSNGDDANTNTTAEGGAKAASKHKRLDQEPAVAVRVMIEDCMALILDVEDVDRIFVASGGKNIENEDKLKQRRVLLVEGLAVSLKLSEKPQRAASESDKLFLRLLAHIKGRVLARRCLRIITPPKEMGAVPPNYRVLWALLRQLGVVFKTSSIPKTDTEVINGLSRLAEGMMAAIDDLSPHALSDAMSALSIGADGASFFAPGENAADTDRKPWMCDVIGALLKRGTDLSLHDTVSKTSDNDHSNAWSQGVADMYDELMALINSEDVDPKSIPVPLIGQHVIKHLSEARKEKLQKRLIELGV